MIEIDALIQSVDFDPETLVAAYERGAPESELLRQPDGPMASPQGLA